MEVELEPVLLAALYLATKRCLGLLIGVLARKRRLSLRVSYVGFFVVRGFHVQLDRGPIAHVWVEEVSLRRAGSFRKAVDGGPRTWDLRGVQLPLAVSGIVVQLRTLPHAAGKLPALPGAGRGGAKQRWPRLPQRFVGLGLRLVAAALHVLAALLPILPLRLKRVTIVCEATGAALEVGGVELAWRSAQLSSQLHAELCVDPIRVYVPVPAASAAGSGGRDGALSGNGSVRETLLAMDEVTAGVDLLITGGNVPLRCESAAVRVGALSLTAAAPLLPALAQLRHGPPPHISNPGDKPQPNRGAQGPPVWLLPAHLEICLPLWEAALQLGGLSRLAVLPAGGAPALQFGLASAEAHAASAEGGAAGGGGGGGRGAQRVLPFRCGGLSFQGAEVELVDSPAQLQGEARLVGLALPALDAQLLASLASSGAGAAEALAAEAAREYWRQCEQAGKNHSGALMHVELEEVEALLVLCGEEPAAEAAALAHIAAVDPPSAGVALTQVKQVRVDALLRNASVRFCGGGAPIAAAAEVRVSGLVAVARQATAPAQTYGRAIAVGRLRSVRVALPAKHARPLVKAFTDLRVAAADVSSTYGVGLEPTIALLAQAGKRLSPTDPDRARAGGASLPWWDLLRLIWRGRLALEARRAEFTLGVTHLPDIGEGAERLHVAAKLVRVRISHGAPLGVAALGVASHGYRGAGLDEAPGALLALPLASFPAGLALIQPTWHLCSGRSADAHHLYPAPGAMPAGARQPPVDPTHEYTSVGLDMTLQIHAGAAAAVAPHVAESGLAPPAHLRMPGKRGTFFARLDPRRPATPGLPKLLRQFDVAVAAAPLEVAYHPPDAGSLAAGLALVAARARYTGRLLLNRPAPGAVLPGASAIARKREAARTTTATLLTDVAADDLRLLFGGGSGPATGSAPQAATAGDPLLALLHCTSPGSPNPNLALGGAPPPFSHQNSLSSDEVRLPGACSGPEAAAPVLAIAAVAVREARRDPRVDAPTDDELKPLGVVVDDCRVLVDLDGRNATWVAVAQLTSAFKMPARWRRPAPHPGAQGADPSPAAGAAATGRASAAQELHGFGPGGETGAAGRRGGRLGRHSSMPVSPSLEGGGELLRMLLQQNESQDEEGGTAEGGGTGGAAAVGEATAAEAVAAMLGGQQDPAEERRQTRALEAKVLAAGTVRYEVEVNGLQVYLTAGTAPGRILLAAARAQLGGRALPASRQVVMTFDMHEVQGHVAQTDIDPGAAPEWLRVADSQLLPSPTAGITLRRVFNPFSWELRRFTAMPAEALAAATTPPASPAMRRSSSGCGAHEVAGEEVRLRVPDIEVAMESREFEILQDAITHVCLAPAPPVELIGREEALLHEAESEEVAAARDAFAALRRQLVSLRAETLAAVVGGSPLAVRRISGARRLAPASVSASRRPSTELLEVFTAASSCDEPVALSSGAQSPGVGWRPAGVGAALQEQFAALALGAGSPAAGGGLAARWGAEQAAGAALALAAARAQLAGLKAAARRTAQDDPRAGRAAGGARFGLEVDGVRWALCRGRAPFAEMALAGVELRNARNADSSGSSRLVIQTAEVLDATGGTPATAFTPAGAVLTLWHPDETWRRDPLLRVNAVLGVPTASHTVYEHLELSVHPLGVHLHEALATSFWDYFFPKEEPSRRQEAWVRSVEPRLARAAGRRGSTASLADPEAAPDASHPVSPPPPDVRALSPPPGERPASADSHRRSRARVAGGVHHHLVKQISVPAASISVHRKASSTEEAGAHGGSGGGATAAERRAERRRRERAAAAGRRALFAHVRLNRVHCRATYQGKPLSFTDFKLLLDRRVYERLEGRWRDLLNRLKWDTIKSAVKSVAGLQGRKFKELLEGFDGEAAEGARGAQAPLLAWLSGLTRKGRPEEDLDEETLRARQKERLLFGKKHVARNAAASAAATSAAIVGSQPGHSACSEHWQRCFAYMDGAWR
ncbi:hypothetical protein WJX81_001629 [Elliptochloris bilobata]|uniref:FMP27 GFWDK domain-containing protein n=1 Tax=Elliptochloris bilobata TaxID=381761 RepID=A0AAW1R1V5_9CHLO